MRSSFIGVALALVLGAGSIASSPAKSAVADHPPRLINASEAFDKSSFPKAPLDRSSQGTTRVRLSVRADGSLQNCEVIGSSGDAELDQQTCNLLVAKGKFEAAEEAGLRIADDFELSIRWQLDEAAIAPQFASRATIKFNKQGRPIDCKFVVTWNGKTQPSQDCKKEAVSQIEDVVGQSEQVRGHTLISEMQIIPDNFVPSPMAPLGAFSISRIVAELGVTPEGTAGSCRVLIDDTHIDGDGGGLGENLCTKILGQQLGLGNPPVGLKPTVRAAQLLYAIE